MLKLYYAPNTIAVAAALALEEGGVHYEPVKVDFSKSEQQSAAYLATNPKGRVPSLATPQGVITEVGAVLEYIGDTAVPALKPKDAFQAAQMRELMFYLASTMHVNHAHKMRGHRWADQESSWADMTAKVPETMAASAAYVETKLAGPFLFGNEPSLADCYLFAITSWLEGDGVALADYPKVSTFQSAMSERPSVAALQAKGIVG